MARPFAIEPRLAPQFPGPDELQSSLVKAPSMVRDMVVRLWLTEGLPYAFFGTPAIYEDLRGWLAHRLTIHPKEITMIGSARIGYSLSPPPKFGRPFNDRSDLDLSIVSSDLFCRVEAAFQNFSQNYASGLTIPKSPKEKHYWDENIKFGNKNIPKGFFDPDKIPNRELYPIARLVSQAMWELQRKLDATPEAPRVRKASVRVYRDWQSFISRVSFNLAASLKDA